MRTNSISIEIAQTEKRHRRGRRRLLPCGSGSQHRLLGTTFTATEQALLGRAAVSLPCTGSDSEALDSDVIARTAMGQRVGRRDLPLVLVVCASDASAAVSRWGAGLRYSVGSRRAGSLSSTVPQTDVACVYESIGVGTDGSETAQRAVAEATRLAKALGGGLHLVSAYEPLRAARIVGAPEGSVKEWDIKPDAAVQSVVEQAAAAVRMGGVEVEVHTVTGDPADALLEVAEAEKADLIVVGNRGMHGLTRVLGSVPNKVSHRARCSVLIVSTDAAD